MLNNFSPKRNDNIQPKKNIFNKNKCDSLNISSLIDGIPTYTQEGKNTKTKTNIKKNKLFKKNKLKKILKSKSNNKDKKNKQNYIFNILLTCFLVLLCIYNIVIMKYDIKLETKK
jgi:hypothetical protein